MTERPSDLLTYLDACDGHDILEFYDEAGCPDIEQTVDFIAMAGLELGDRLGDEVVLSVNRHRVEMRRVGHRRSGAVTPSGPGRADP